MRISDWSSDVCSSDLARVHALVHRPDVEGAAQCADRLLVDLHQLRQARVGESHALEPAQARRVERDHARGGNLALDRARKSVVTGRVCQSVYIAVVAESLNKK